MVRSLCRWTTSEENARGVPAKQETHEGGCHCGRVRFRIRADLGQLGECNCSICMKKGILHQPVLREDFELLLGADALTTYRLSSLRSQVSFKEENRISH